MLSPSSTLTNQILAGQPGSLQKQIDLRGRHGEKEPRERRAAGLPEAFQNSATLYPEGTEAPWKHSKQASDLSRCSF